MTAHQSLVCLDEGHNGKFWLKNHMSETLWVFRQELIAKPDGILDIEQF